MTPAMATYLNSMTPQQRAKVARDSSKALRLAWPARHSSMRAGIVIRSNVAMLRNLRSI